MTAGVAGSGATHPVKIVANIFISFIGAGVLGLPFAYKEAGLAEGILIMVTVGYVSIRAMFLLIDCKYLLLSKRRSGNVSVNTYVKSNVPLRDGSVELKLPLLNGDAAGDDEGDKILVDTSHEITYGDLGFYAYAEKGRWLVDGTVIVSQIGFCCAYLIFISENLSTYVSGVSTSQWLVLFLPLLYMLCLLRKLEKLAVFSIFAQISTIMAFAVVFWFDFEHYYVMERFHPREFSSRGFPFFFAIAIYCYEGAGMILSLENSLAEHVRPKFKMYFGRTMFWVTALYVVFGCSGYISFGPETREIITLNLPPSDGTIDFAMVVKCCLCFSLFFTYPLMMFPVVTIIEKRLPASYLTTSRGNVLRLLLVATSGLVVVMIPNFANLMAIIGGTCCTLLAFVLPGLFHLRLRRRSITRKEKIFDMFLIGIGVVGAVIATTDALSRMAEGSDEPLSPSSAVPVAVTNVIDTVQAAANGSGTAAGAASKTAAAVAASSTASAVLTAVNDTASVALAAANDTISSALATVNDTASAALAAAHDVISSANDTASAVLAGANDSAAVLAGVAPTAAAKDTAFAVTPAAAARMALDMLTNDGSAPLDVS
ncbi:amino acid transporter ANT1-like isoform X1 [Amphibalanus amphitrite]|uniref:amino acid transporter ANT1-like isoform X1 n=1 Tax=Amphibalanus amphitrite TaxID=1232801 RepID=UPI001C90574D|nr:amino acid transporter ANT1-like isoform X1 [Amphibalanus amphitrite]XP_043226187.1 amino acid transporter ANT1-like isoform X1 [Amphibalanus amphitrite]